MSSSQKKIALCFLISYEHTLQKEEFWKKWIEPNSDIINIYFHYKRFDKIKSSWIKTYALPPSFIKQTSYYNVVPAYISIMSFAYSHDINNVWCCMLTDSCVPIISPTMFRQLFYTHYSQSLFKWSPAYWNIHFHHRANLRLLKEKYWLSNVPWFIFTRQHIQQCFLFITTQHNIYRQINNGGLANESIFAIILETFNELTTDNVINTSSTIADWTRMPNPTSPYLFTENTIENKDKINQLIKQNPFAFFLRKVHSSFPDYVLQEIINERI